MVPELCSDPQGHGLDLARPSHSFRGVEAEAPPSWASGPDEGVCCKYRKDDE